MTERLSVDVPDIDAILSEVPIQSVEINPNDIKTTFCNVDNGSGIETLRIFMSKDCISKEPVLNISRETPHSQVCTFVSVNPRNYGFRELDEKYISIWTRVCYASLLIVESMISNGYGESYEMESGKSVSNRYGGEVEGLLGQVGIAKELLEKHFPD